MTLEEVDIISHAETKFYKIYKSEIIERNHPKNVKASSPTFNLHSIISQKTEIVIMPDYYLYTSLTPLILLSSTHKMTYNFTSSQSLSPHFLFTLPFQLHPCLPIGLFPSGSFTHSVSLMYVAYSIHFNLM